LTTFREELAAAKLNEMVVAISSNFRYKTLPPSAEFQTSELANCDPSLRACGLSAADEAGLALACQIAASASVVSDQAVAKNIERLWDKSSPLRDAPDISGRRDRRARNDTTK
jgi:hypothetical protein